MNIARWLDEQGPDWPTAHVALIDALRDYVRACEGDTRDLLDEGSITGEQAMAEAARLVRFRVMLADLEDDQLFDPTLRGLLREG